MESKSVSLWKPRYLIISHLILLIATLFCILPFTAPIAHAIDEGFFIIMNSSLEWGSWWQVPLAYLNHQNERMISPLLKILFNCLCVYSLKPTSRKKAAAQFIAFWLLMELIIPLFSSFIRHVVHIKRLSPTAVYPNALRIGVLTGIAGIRDYSVVCFVSGHAFVLSFWAGFTYFVAPKRLGQIALSFAFIMSLPRLFVGGHWLTDVLFGFMFSGVFLSWILATPLHEVCSNRFVRAFDSIRSIATKLQDKSKATS
jgi:membrane-associated phospholipid phosphatase